MAKVHVDVRWVVERILTLTKAQAKERHFDASYSDDGHQYRVMVGPFHDRGQAVTWAVSHALGSTNAFKIHPVFTDDMVT